VAALLALGIDRVPIREPRLRVVRAGGGEIIGAAASLIASAIEAEGGVASIKADTLEATLNGDADAQDFDAVVAIGGTGSGANDKSVRTLDRAGKVTFHGIGITPGETTAFGTSRSAPNCPRRSLRRCALPRWCRCAGAAFASSRWRHTIFRCRC
jgi:molybdopterin biosynthesis enzyme